MIQIRNVPEDLHRRLKARAAGQEARAVVPKGGTGDVSYSNCTNSRPQAFC